MADKIIAPIAMALFLVFIAFLAVYINEINLWCVLVIVSVLAVYDFYRTLVGGNGNSSG